jgi:hypothetical protein
MENLSTKQIVEFLKEKGSSNVKKRMLESHGEEFCTSYIEANIQEHKVSKEDALGWLEQDLSEFYNN